MATAWAQTPTTTEKPPAKAGALPSGSQAASVKVNATVEAIDKDKGTVTLKGPKRTVTVAVNDKSKLDLINVGDPVVATYTEAVAFQVLKAGSAAPALSVREGQASSKPGENPAGAVARTVTLTASIEAIDKKAQTVTIKGPEGRVETIKVKNPKNLEGVKVGDMVDITYAQALAVALDLPASKYAGTWTGTGRVWDLNGPIEIKIAPNGSFSGMAAGNPITGTLKITDRAITFDSAGPRGGAAGAMNYYERGGKEYLGVSAKGKYAGQPLDFNLVKQ
jgi:hypothetical protein